MRITVMFILFLCIFACTKPGPVGPMYPVNQEAKSIFQPFNNGSWWIFRNDSTKETDSAVATGITDGPSSMPPVKNRRMEWIFWGIKWTKNAGLSCQLVAASDPEQCDFLITYGTNKSIQVSRKSSGYEGYEHSEPRPTVKILKTFTIDTATYTNVLYTKDNNPGGEAYYFAKGIGLIGRDIMSGNYTTRLRVIRYKIL
jgi:hypothetical protein